MRIGELAARAGIRARSIRHDEKAGRSAPVACASLEAAARQAEHARSAIQHQEATQG